ncbi:GAF domain-containing protein [Jatrophihabitans endophyticus]|uniref:GAF domain-containing protein n=1 Tax=Jatrophihabitans endophyticus TaxID=1206085 RepID=A0A1M5KBU6_9ACTN|nr:GAF and ANTAR domain-containing protein [Jatrophihabitans endophyticus]SHG49633.1 GAF domain-containing protein [Jatrophihabitans endophyticus]
MSRAVTALHAVAGVVGSDRLHVGGALLGGGAALFPQADAVGVVHIAGGGRADTSCADCSRTAATNREQHHLREGAWLDCAKTRTVIRSTDRRRDVRWTAWAEARDVFTGASVLALPLVGRRGLVGVLTAYAERPAAFDDEDEDLLVAVSRGLGAALDAVLMEHNLRIALESRGQVARAVGILMERFRIGEQDAFDRIRVASQRTHVKVRDVAEQVELTGEDPLALAVASADGAPHTARP